MPPICPVFDSRHNFYWKPHRHRVLFVCMDLDALLWVALLEQWLEQMDPEVPSQPSHGCVWFTDLTFPLLSAMQSHLNALTHQSHPLWVPAFISVSPLTGITRHGDGTLGRKYSSSFFSEIGVFISAAVTVPYDSQGLLSITLQQKLPHLEKSPHPSYQRHIVLCWIKQPQTLN